MDLKWEAKLLRIERSNDLQLLRLLQYLIDKPLIRDFPSYQHLSKEEKC